MALTSQFTESKRIPRYIMVGSIRRVCPRCFEDKELVVFQDDLTDNIIKLCRACITEIKINLVKE
jgi:hypothetical protein